MTIDAPYRIALGVTERCSLFCEPCHLKVKALKEGARDDPKIVELNNIQVEIAEIRVETIFVLIKGKTGGGNNG